MGSNRTIAFASVIWASSIFLSRVIALVREQIIGRTLGATRQADLYFASFTLPDFLNYLLAAGALSIVFIPIFVEYVERGEHDQAWRALSVIANFILVVGGTMIALLMIFARPLAGFVAPGFTGPGELETLTHLIRIILPAQIFLAVGGLLSAALQAQDRHLLPAMAPLIYSDGNYCRRPDRIPLRRERGWVRMGCPDRSSAGAVRATIVRLHAQQNAMAPHFSLSQIRI